MRKPLSKISLKAKLLSNLVFGIKQNMVLKDDKGGEFYVYSEDPDFVGDTVVVMENGSPTDKYAEDGTYNVTDESGAKHTLTIAGGVVTEQQS
ncbi:MAG: hypothetical protein ACRCXN_12880, partial [Bacteroidales bacterium]